MALVTNHYFSRKLVIAFSTSKYHERSYIFISIDSSRRDQSIDIQIIGWRRRRHLLQFYRECERRGISVEFALLFGGLPKETECDNDFEIVQGNVSEK